MHVIGVVSRWDMTACSPTRDVSLGKLSVGGIKTVYLAVGLWLNFLLHGVFVVPVLTQCHIVKFISHDDTNLADVRAVVCIVFLTVTLYLLLIRIQRLHGAIDLLPTEAARRSQRRISEKAVLPGCGKVRILSCFKLLWCGKKEMICFHSIPFQPLLNARMT